MAKYERQQAEVPELRDKLKGILGETLSNQGG